MQAMGEIKWINHSEPFSFHALGFEEGHFLYANLYSEGKGEELNPLRFERNIMALRRSPKGARGDGNWF